MNICSSTPDRKQKLNVTGGWNQQDLLVAGLPLPMDENLNTNISENNFDHFLNSPLAISMKNEVDEESQQTNYLQKNHQQLHTHQKPSTAILGQLTFPSSGIEFTQTAMTTDERIKIGNGERALLAPLSGGTNITQEQITHAQKDLQKLLSKQASKQEELEKAERKVHEAQASLATLSLSKKRIDDKVESRSKELMDVLLQDPDQPWNKMYHKLVAFKKRYKRCDVKKPVAPEWKELRNWITKQRTARRKSCYEGLEPYQIYALDRLGFEWDPREKQWMEMYKGLEKYMEIHGRGSMPTRGERRSNGKKDSLGIWCSGQVIAYNKFKRGEKSYMTEKKIKTLNEIGFVWDRNSHTWNLQFYSLKKFHKDNGHCRVPKDHANHALYNWVVKQRKHWKNFQKSKTPCQTHGQWILLNSLGFMNGLVY